MRKTIVFIVILLATLSPTPVPAPAAAPIVPASTAPPAVARPLRPLPGVRVRGGFTPTGARVTFWGALAMALTAGVGALFGAKL